VSTLALVSAANAFPMHGSKFVGRFDDACAQAYVASVETTTGYFSASLALQCLQQLPYDKNIALAHIDSFKKTFNFYAPESYAIQSPNSNVTMDVDIPTSLQTIEDGIKSRVYSYFEYQYALDTLVRSLNDGSFPVLLMELIIGRTYYSNPCVRGFMTRFPLPTVLLSPNGLQDPVVYVLPPQFLSDYRSFLPWKDGLTDHNWNHTCKQFTTSTSQYSLLP